MARPKSPARQSDLKRAAWAKGRGYKRYRSTRPCGTCGAQEPWRYVREPDVCQHCKKQRVKRRRAKLRDDPNYCHNMSQRWLRWTMKQKDESKQRRGFIKYELWRQLTEEAARRAGKTRAKLLRFPGNERD